MEKCRSLNQAPRRLDFSGKTSGRPILRVAESFKWLNPSELPQTPLPSRTRLKKTIAFPVANGTNASADFMPAWLAAAWSLAK